MALISNILFPVDFSPASVAMAPYVKRAAGICHASVSLVHVVDLASHSGFELYLRPPSEIAEEHLEIGRERLASFLTSEFPATECSRILVSGDAATEIAKVARTGEFDLIIMPTHSGIFRQMLIGSTTAKVINDTDCPVMTSRHAQTISPKPLNHREWLCSIGLSSNSERILRFASRAAAELSVNLSIIHALPSADQALLTDLDLEEQVESTERQEARRRIADLQRTVGSAATVRIPIGPIKDALIETARRADADVLIIGRSPRPGAQGRMRDLTYAVLRDSPLPVVTY